MIPEKVLNLSAAKFTDFYYTIPIISPANFPYFSCITHFGLGNVACIEIEYLCITMNFLDLVRVINKALHECILK